MSFSPTYLGNISISRTLSNSPLSKNQKKLEHQFIQTAYNRVFSSLKSQHTIFVTLQEFVQHFNLETVEEGENGKDKEILSKFKKILNLILNSYYGNLFQINFAASDLIEKILNPSESDQNTLSKPLSTEIEKLGYKILSACLSIKRLVSILSFTNYISAQLRYSKSEKANNNNNNFDKDFADEIIENEDDYQFDTFDSGERASSLGEKHAFPILSKMQHHKRIHHSNHNAKVEKVNEKVKKFLNNNVNSKNNDQFHKNMSDQIPTENKNVGDNQQNEQLNQNKENENANKEVKNEKDQNKQINNDQNAENNKSLSDQISTENINVNVNQQKAKTEKTQNEQLNQNQENENIHKEVKNEKDQNEQINNDQNAENNKILSDQIPTENKSAQNNQKEAKTDKNQNQESEKSMNSQQPAENKNVYDNIFHMVDDSTVLDSGSDTNDYYDSDKSGYSDGYYSDYYYYDDDEDYDKEPTVICRICEKEVPLSMIEEHSKSCVIAYESSKTMKSTDDHMRKLQAFAQQTVLHVEWPCNEDYAKSVVIPILHVVALLDRAISIDLNSNGAPEELDVICSCLNAISIKRNQPNKQINENVENGSKIKTIKKSVTSVQIKAIASSASNTPTDKTKSTNNGSVQDIESNEVNTSFQEALSILSRARALVNEKSSASSSLSAAIDVFKQTTYLGMRGDVDDISVCIRREATIADFSFIRRISSGAYAKVYLTRKNQTGDLSATKVIHRDSLRQKNDLQRVMVEKNILAEVSNPFMIRFFFSIIGKNNLYLVMEYCPGGDLYSVLQNIGTFPEDKAWLYTAEVVEALEFLRKKNVIHRDLKPDNLLVARNGHLKLTDFGMSAFGIFDRSVNDQTASQAISSEQESINNVERRDSHDSIKNGYSSTVSLPGTPDYIAPEIILQQPHTFTADYWSLGCIIYELLTGIPPFHGDTPETTFANVVKGVYDEALLLSYDVSDEAVDLIRKLLTRDPKKRLGSKSINEIKQHPWFSNQGIDWNHLLDMEPPFVPQLENEEDTSYFEERYAMSNDDEKDIREDIELAKVEMANKSNEKKTQSFFSDKKQNLFSESTPTPPLTNQSKNNKQVSLTTTPDKQATSNNTTANQNEESSHFSTPTNSTENVSAANKNQNKDNQQQKTAKNNNSYVQTSGLNITPKGPMSQPSRTNSNMSTNSNTGNYHTNSDDELSLFPSLSSGSLQTLTIEDSMKKFKKLQDEASSNEDGSLLSPKIRVSRSSHNIHRMILNEMRKEKLHSRQIGRNNSDVKGTHNQNVEEKQLNLFDSGSNNISSRPRRRIHSKFHSSTNLSSYSNNYDEYSDEVSQSPHFVESKSVSSFQDKLCMTPENGTKKKRRHSHKRSHRSASNKNSDEAIYSSSSSNLLSLLQHENANSHVNNGEIQNVKDSALVNDNYSNSPSVKNNQNDKNEYPLSKYVKSDLDDDESESEDADDI